jgi:hypothetical protein
MVTEASLTRWIIILILIRVGTLNKKAPLREEC